MKKKIVISILLIVTTISFIVTIYHAKNKPYYQINLETLTFEEKEKGSNIKIYTIDDFDTFYKDYQNNDLPDIYITKFLFDGVSMYRDYDLDDYLEKGNTYVPKVVEITNLNIHNIGKYELSGSINDAMISINTNDLMGRISLLLNGVRIDTNSKKVPVVYVYNKDINYTSVDVTVNTINNTENYLSGGKLKKVSLIAKEKLNDFVNKYTKDNLNNYNNYSNYYGIYSEEELNNILFARIEASDDDLKDGDPAYFYKAAGAISSDIDLSFEGDGYLEVNSKNKEGIESKGNLSFLGSNGDYFVQAYDDCLNTTTKGDQARNNIYIDVKSLHAIVSMDADEGDAIDSNGELIIANGEILAIAKPGADAGLDAQKGVYLNGGEIIATGDMYDEIKKDSLQRFMVFSFMDTPKEGEIIVLTEELGIPIFAFKTMRSYQKLVYSSPKILDQNYYLYKTNNIWGEEINGLYRTISNYEKNEQLAHSNVSTIEERGLNDLNEKKGDARRNPEAGRDFPKNDGDRPPMIEHGNMMQPFDKENLLREFNVSGIVNMFNGIMAFNEE